MALYSVFAMKRPVCATCLSLSQRNRTTTAANCLHYMNHKALTTQREEIQFLPNIVLSATSRVLVCVLFHNIKLLMFI